MQATRAGSDVRPDRATFRDLGRTWPLVPMWAELLADVSTPVGVFLSLAGAGRGALLESVERSERWGRYSFVAGEPAATLVVEPGGARLDDVRRDLPADPGPATGATGALENLQRFASALRAPNLADLPSLTGGLVGYLAYEAASLLDGLPHPGDRPPCPAMAFHVVDRAVVFDHWRQRLLLVAHVPAGGDAAYRRGIEAVEELAASMSRSAPPPPSAIAPDRRPRAEPVPSIDERRFRAGVERIREHILAGDIFQAVLSRRFSVPGPEGAFPVYRRLRVTNPSPYMFFLRFRDMELAGSSPEPLVRVEGRRVMTRPIAGTRPRGTTPEDDARLVDELLADPKERAEHAMLVDLARNDLGKVCRPGTVAPTELMTVERFSRVMHIVSTVEGELDDGRSALDALAAAFPAGTVTGAPKRRAMEIIAEEEPVTRGPYAGAVGYVTFAGDLEFCITIRTAVASGGELHVQSGAGVVADSDPERELRETDAKASAILAAVEGVDPR